MSRTHVEEQAKDGGGPSHKVTLDQVQPIDLERGEDLLDLDEAIRRLEEVDRKKAELVKLRYFAGLSIPQAAAVLSVSSQLPTAIGLTLGPGFTRSLRRATSL